jgi:hypothetical protein
VFDAIMSPSAYRARGPRLGDDDRDAAQCFYPHSLSLTEPAAGSTLEAGTTRTVRWQSTAESGPDPGTVSLEWSADSGATWEPLADDVPADATWAWTVPSQPTSAARVRVVRRPRAGPNPSPWPATCTAATSGTFAITVPPIVAGRVGDSLRVERTGDGVRLTWSPSCSAQALDYAVYEGALDALRAGTWSPTAATCSTAGALEAVLPAVDGSRYYLIAARADGAEGDLGFGAGGAPRPAAPEACAPRESDSACD